MVSHRSIPPLDKRELRTIRLAVELLSQKTVYAAVRYMLLCDRLGTDSVGLLALARTHQPDVVLDDLPLAGRPVLDPVFLGELPHPVSYTHLTLPTICSV